MKPYAECAEATRDVLRTLHAKQRECLIQPCGAEIAEQDKRLARVRALTGEEVIDIVLRSAPLFSRALTARIGA